MDSEETDPRVPATPAGDDLEGDTLARERAAVGTMVGARYRLQERLAVGGMGEVYRAEHVELGRPFALKLMRRELSDDPGFVERFRREAVTASRLGHPNIVDIVDSGRSETGQFYFVMELLDGPTLAGVLRREGPLPVPLVVDLVTQMARGLAVAHRAGVVHRDLKPDNVIVLERPGQGRVVKLVDFGIAKQVQPAPGVKQTTVGVIVGTPQYMAPEQAAGLPVDARADLYALGLILYELLVGTPPFTATTAVLLMSKHISDPPPELPARFPATLRRLVAALLAKAPSERPASMEAVMEALARVPVDLPVAGEASRRPPPKWWIPAGALAAACAVVVAWGLWLRPSPAVLPAPPAPPPPPVAAPVPEPAAAPELAPVVAAPALPLVPPSPDVAVAERTHADAGPSSVAQGAQPSHTSGPLRPAPLRRPVPERQGPRVPESTLKAFPGDPP